MSNLIDALKARCPEDISTIRAMHPILTRFSDTEIGRLWEAFSSDRAAGWLHADGTNLVEFAEWIQE